MTTEPRRFVIHEPTMLVALDLECCLRDHDPQARIVQARSLADALRLVAEGSVDLAVLHTGAAAIPTTDVPVMLIGDAAEDEPGSHAVLMRPFSAEDVSGVLLRLRVRPGYTCDSAQGDFSGNHEGDRGVGLSGGAGN